MTDVTLGDIADIEVGLVRLFYDFAVITTVFSKDRRHGFKREAEGMSRMLDISIGDMAQKIENNGCFRTVFIQLCDCYNSPLQEGKAWI